jgi:RHS repeat-associated protein
VRLALMSHFGRQMNSCTAGFPDAIGLVGDPVDVITGANVDRALDVQLAGPIPLLWIRHYNSAKNQSHYSLGWGHAHEYERWLQFDVDGIRYVGPLGTIVGFPPLRRDGSRFARGGFVLHRVTSTFYRVYHSGAPAMEFDFREHSAGPLTRLVEGGSAVQFYYDSRGWLEGIQDSRGWRIRVTHDDSGRVLALLRERSGDAGDRPLLEYQYDPAGNLISGVDSYRNSFSFEYNHNRQMVKRTDRLGYSFLFEYDKRGRCTRSSGEDGLHDTHLRYMPQEGITVVTRPDGGEWTYLYPGGRLSQIIDPYGGMREFKRDGQGRVIEETDTNGNVTRLLYDSAGGLHGKSSSLGHYSQVSDDHRGPGPTEHRFPNLPLEWEYGNVYGTLRPGQDIRLPAPDEASLSEVPESFKKHVRTRKVTVVTGTAIAQAQGPVYDDFGKLVKESGPEGTSRRWLYDANGSVHRVTDCDGAQYTYEHASWDLRTRVINPLGEAVAFKYTNTQQLAAFRDRGGSVSEYEYDLKDRLIRVSRHGGVREQYRYDAAGNLVEKLDGEGNQLLSFEIGPGNLTLVKRLASGNTHSYDYDEKGRLLRAATDDSEVLFEYDRFGHRVKDQRNGQGVTHRFITRGRLLTTTYFARFETHYRHTPSGALAIRDPRGLEHRIQALGNGLFLRTMAHGSTELAQFSERGQCLVKATARRRGTGMWARRYSYSSEGDLLEITDTMRGTVRYVYDAAHRLIRAELPQGQGSFFQYDSGGNLLQQPGLADVAVRDGNRLNTANGDRFEYNARNHISGRSGRSVKTSYRYDSCDMLTACENGHGRWEAQYDALGRRIRKNFGGNKTEFYWDRDRVAAEVRNEGTVRLYIYADDFALTPLLFVDYASLDADPKDGKGYYVFGNHLGAPLLVEDDSGNVTWAAQVDPYGAARIEPHSVLELNLRFPGHYYDTETGLQYNRFRYYSPELGRYLQSDPVGIRGGPNLYSYPANPLKRVDVLGLCPDGGPDDPPPTVKNPPATDKEDTDFNDEVTKPNIKIPIPAEEYEPPGKPPLTGGRYADDAAGMTPYGEQWDKDHNVRIFTPEEREDCRVVSDSQGRLVYATTGEPVDGSNLIYVMDQNGNVYVTEPETGVVHHSSLAGGEPVAGAGHMVADNGDVGALTDDSGHYGKNLPTNQPQKVSNELGSQGVDSPGKGVDLFTHDKPANPNTPAAPPPDSDSGS